MNALAVRFEQVVGVGPVLVGTMLSSCPDIGSFTSKGIAKMAGVAPIENKSCTIRKKSKPRRGRRELRSALYMAAVSACHSVCGAFAPKFKKGSPSSPPFPLPPFSPCYLLPALTRKKEIQKLWLLWGTIEYKHYTPPAVLATIIFTL